MGLHLCVVFCSLIHDVHDLGTLIDFKIVTSSDRFITALQFILISDEKQASIVRLPKGMITSR